jgi:hypothetical protein
VLLNPKPSCFGIKTGRGKPHKHTNPNPNPSSGAGAAAARGKREERLRRLKESTQRLVVAWALAGVCLLGHAAHMFPQVRRIQRCKGCES